MFIELELPSCVPILAGPWSIDSVLRVSVDKHLQAWVEERVRKVANLAKHEVFVAIPVIRTGLEHGPLQKGWIGDGVSSFFCRVYDSGTGQQAVIRASRHAILAAGVSGRLYQELINLAIEKMLYPAFEQELKRRVSPKHIFGATEAETFAFIEGLARYSIPTENSVYMQRRFAALAVFFAVFQIGGGFLALEQTDFWFGISKWWAWTLTIVITATLGFVVHLTLMKLIARWR
jgi:hypothetical protein